MEGMKNIAANLGLRQRTPDECATVRECERRADKAWKKARAMKKSLKEFTAIPGGSADTGRKWRITHLLEDKDFHPHSSSSARKAFAKDKALNERNEFVAKREKKIQEQIATHRRLSALAIEIAKRPYWVDRQAYLAERDNRWRRNYIGEGKYGREYLKREEAEGRDPEMNPLSALATRWNMETGRPETAADLRDAGNIGMGTQQQNERWDRQAGMKHGRPIYGPKQRGRGKKTRRRRRKRKKTHSRRKRRTHHKRRSRRRRRHR